MRGQKEIIYTREGSECIPKMHRFVDVLVPVKACNLRCHYCYITQNKLFNSKVQKFSFSPEILARGLSRKRLGGTCLINFCGEGETLLPSEMPECIKAVLSEGHFVMVVTNGTVKKNLSRLAVLPRDYLERLFFKFSFHYLELKEKGLIDSFCSNVRMVRDAGASFSIEITPSDELIPYIDEVKEVCMREFGALCHVTVARDERDKSTIPILTKMSRSDYSRIWSVFRSPLFDFKMSVFGEKRRDFCYAGKWTYFFSLETGLLFQCYGCCALQNIYSQACSKIKQLAVGHFCPLPHCYNAHVFLAIGAVSGREDPSYAMLRNRKCTDGSEWIRPKMKAFLSQKLDKNNTPFSFWGRIFSDIRCMFLVAYRVLYRVFWGRSQI